MLQNFNHFEHADSFGEPMKNYSNEERLNFAKSIQSSKGETLIHESVRIGQNCAIGGDGFGYAREPDGTLVKMPHTGNVIIEAWVEIGSNVCIDRAVVGSTIIGEGTKVDNLVHIAHGVKIGRNCLIVAGTVIGGSCEIGDNCFIGINASIKNKVKIGNNVTIGMGAIVLKDVPDGMTVYGVWKGVGKLKTVNDVRVEYGFPAIEGGDKLIRIVE